MKSRTTNQYIDGLIDALLSGDDDALRVAQYGGRGGGGGMYGPGGTPQQGGGGTAGGLGRAWNDFNTDANFEARLESVHKPAAIDPERNIEKRLECQHVLAEEDQINYELSFAERMKLKRRQQIHRREKFLEDAAKRIDENSPSYIREKFHDKKHTLTPFEQTLESRRLQPDYSALEELQPQIKPTRRHTVAKAWAPQYPKREQADIFSGVNQQHTNDDGGTGVDYTNTQFDQATQDTKEKDPSGGPRNNPDGGAGYKSVPSGKLNQEQTLQQLQDDAKNDEEWMTKDLNGAFSDPGLDEYEFQLTPGTQGPTTGWPSLVDFLRSQLGQMQNGNQSVQQQLDYARQDDGGKRKLNAPKRPQNMHNYKPNGDLVRRNRMDDYTDENGDKVENVHWDGMWDDPDYTEGDKMGQLWMGPSI